jgi:hypothetical protein
MRILITAITALVIFVAVCFASNPNENVLAAKGVLKPTHRATDPRSKIVQLPTSEQNAGSPSSSILPPAKARALKSQETY